MQNRTEFLFTHTAIGALKELRGTEWKQLATRVAQLPSTHPDALAFALMMVRLNNCVSCDALRFRERGGCARCARFVLTTLVKENEVSLLARYRAARNEIARALPVQLLEKQAA
ncbi:MAG: hypothetical protein HY070_02285 [Chloroflexi bacterium]|nr:hypothetical protein [Chloroflexota bacterium]